MNTAHTPQPANSANANTNARKSRKLSPSVVNFDRLPDSAHIDLQDLMILASCCRSTVYNWVASGVLPAPRKLGPTRNFWTAGDIRKALSL